MPTIQPLTSEEVWLSRLAKISAWPAPLQPTLVLAPHPDDETLGAGGLIARLRGRGVPVRVVAITDGEGAYEDEPELAAVRVEEQTLALARLGVAADEIYRLGLPDRRVSEYEDQLCELLEGLVTPGMHLVAPWTGDFHPDHEAAGRAAARVAARAGLMLTSYLFWTWHRGRPETLDGCSLVALELSEEERERKRYALAAHASQTEHADGQPILSDELLLPARRRFEVYIRP